MGCVAVYLGGQRPCSPCRHNTLGGSHSILVHPSKRSSRLPATHKHRVRIFLGRKCDSYHVTLTHSSINISSFKYSTTLRIVRTGGPSRPESKHNGGHTGAATPARPATRTTAIIYFLRNTSDVFRQDLIIQLMLIINLAWAARSQLGYRRRE